MGKRKMKLTSLDADYSNEQEIATAKVYFSDGTTADIYVDPDNDELSITRNLNQDLKKVRLVVTGGVGEADFAISVQKVK